jgi:hypothetical protein
LDFLTIVPQHNATEGDMAKAKAKAKKATKTKSSGKAKRVRVVAKRVTGSKPVRTKVTSAVISWDQFVEKVRNMHPRCARRLVRISKKLGDFKTVKVTLSPAGMLDGTAPK